MAHKHREGEEPSLELPSLFGRRRKAAPAAEESLESPAPVPPERAEPLAAGGDDTTVLEPVEAVPPPPPPPPPPAVEDLRPPGRRRTAARALPEVPADAASFLAGAVVGLLGCALTYLGLQGCEVLTGTDSCGGPGLLVLVLIVVAMVVGGAALLRLLGVREAGSISFLGVGIAVVVVLLFLIDNLYDAWMFAVFPGLTAVAYALARWVTTRFPEEDVLEDDGAEPRDVR